MNSSRLRASASDRAGSAVERVTFTNRTALGTVVFLSIGLGQRAQLANPSYSVAITRAPVPR